MTNERTEVIAENEKVRVSNVWSDEITCATLVEYKYHAEFSWIEEGSCRHAGYVFAETKELAREKATAEFWFKGDELANGRAWEVQVSNWSRPEDSTWPQDIIDARARRF